MLKFKFIRSLIFLVGAAVLWMACNLSTSKAPKKLLDYFTEVPARDTFLFEIPEDKSAIHGDTIPTSFFFSHFETQLMNGISYLDDSEGLTVLGGQRFPLSKNLEACQVYLFQNWFQNRSLFLFDKNKMKFTGRVTVAEFYGGEGGQILTGSWLFDYDGNGNRDLVRTEIEHWLDLSNDEPAEKVESRVSLLLWGGNEFSEGNVPDSAALMQACPIKSWW